MQQQDQSLTELCQLTQAIVWNTVASVGAASTSEAAMISAASGVVSLRGADILGTNVLATKKLKLELPQLFAGNPAKLSTWIFAAEQYGELFRIYSN